MSRELTWGEKFVSVSFNPSSIPEVDSIKAAAAIMADELHTQRLASKSPEQDHRFEVALDDLLKSQMEGVKAATLAS